MREPSERRRRTLELQDRTRRFSVGVLTSCPKRFPDDASETVWGQLVRAADSTSNNLVEADDASSGDDFVYKMKLTLREAKESREGLIKLRLGRLCGFEKVADLEREAGELTAIFATIIINTQKRHERERREAPQRKRGRRT